jgi:hypothetical protein
MESYGKKMGEPQAHRKSGNKDENRQDLKALEESRGRSWRKELFSISAIQLELIWKRNI